MRVGFVSARSVSVDDGLWTDAGMGRLIDAVQHELGPLTVALSVSPHRLPLHDHRIGVPQNRFIGLPWLPSVTRGFHKAWACRRGIADVESRCDALIIQLPFAAPLALFGGDRPRLYHVCADVLRIVGASSWYRGTRRIPAVLLAHGIDRLERHLVHRHDARTVTNGEELFRHLGVRRGRAVVSASLHAEEVGAYQRRRPDDAPFRLIYVGYLRHEKGVDLLLEAFERLLVEVPDAELLLVGASNVVDRGEGNLTGERLDRLVRRGRVTFSGAIAFGGDLFAALADGDVLVVPSRSEGTPRVVTEARAMGCPVVATAVGGLPTSIKDGVDGLLVPPEDSAAICEALLRIARDARLRETLISRGYERAREQTVESFAQQIAAEVRLAAA